MPLCLKCTHQSAAVIKLTVLSKYNTCSTLPLSAIGHFTPCGNSFYSGGVTAGLLGCCGNKGGIDVLYRQPILLFANEGDRCGCCPISMHTLFFLVGVAPRFFSGCLSPLPPECILDERRQLFLSP